MADRYWVGGTGTWDATTTTNWSATSGGAAGASAPTSADNVFFNADSNVGAGAFTVTIGTNAACNNFLASGLDGAMTLTTASSTARLYVYGNWDNPTANFSVASSSGIIVFAATTTGKTIVTNNDSFGTDVEFNGAGGGWELGSAFTTTRDVFIEQGSFSTSTSNYSLTALNLYQTSSLAKTISFNASTVTINLRSVLTGSNLTLNAGTSQFNMTNSYWDFEGPSDGTPITFYNVSFTDTTYENINSNFTGNLAFNNLTIANRAATGVLTITVGGNMTVAGTLTVSTANVGIRRVQLFSNSASVQRTFTVATLATTNDVDFKSIAVTGASAPWSGNRFGNGGNNSGITFPAAKTVYWSSGGSGNYSGNVWATSIGGAGSALNFPLAQDTALVVDTGLGSGATITLDDDWLSGTFDASAVTKAFNLVKDGTASPRFYGDLIFSSTMTFDGNAQGSIIFYGYGNTQTLNTAGKTLNITGIALINFGGVLSLAGNVTISGTLNLSNFAVTLSAGKLSLNTRTLAIRSFGGEGAETRELDFGTGAITLNGTASTLLDFGTDATGLTISGAGSRLITATGARTITASITVPNLTAANAFSVTVSAGSGDIDLGTSNAKFNNLTFGAGFTGDIQCNNSIIVLGNFSVGGASGFSGAGTLSFLGTSGTQTISMNNLSYPTNVVFGSSATNSTTFSLTTPFNVVGNVTFGGGTLNLPAGATSTVGGNFSTTGTTLKTLQSTTSGTQATLSKSAGTVNVSYLSIKDNAATGGATFTAPLGINLDSGNNTGWNFTAASQTNSSFLLFFI